MHLQSTLITAAPFLLAFASALPSNLDARGVTHPTERWTCGPSCSKVVFNPDEPTCGGAKYLDSLKTTTTVIVEPDCNIVIDTICKAAEKLVKTQQPVHSLTATFGTCKGDFLISTTEADPKEVNYDTCVKAFQGISSGCMLNVGVGKQYGAQNVEYREKDGNQWTASTQYQQKTPGYLLGPSPDIWGAANWQNEMNAALI